MNSLFTKKQILFKLFLSALLLAFLVVFFEAWQNWQTFLGFTFAYILGCVLLFLDEQYLYRFYAEKLESRVDSSSHFPELASRNVMFLLSLPFLSIFVATSSGSVMGIAMILAINFYLLVEMWQLKDEFLLFQNRFLAMSKTRLSRIMVQRLCWGVSAYFVFLLIILFN
jgi:hypothetical protein